MTEVRPGNTEGNAPSASAGTLVQRPMPRLLGLSVTAVIVIAGAILALLVVAGVVIPNARRRARARDDGTYGRR